MTRSFKRGITVLLSLTMMTFVSLGVANGASAKPRTTDPAVTAVAAPVTGTLTDGTGAVNGTFDVQRFVVRNGNLQALGTFTGTVTDAAGAATSGTQQISLPVNANQSQGSCEILDLVLGPLDLNLLGLEVHLDTVHLNITAQQAPGNLLGNLLCAVAGLLDRPVTGIGLVQPIANLLNRIIAILG